MAAERNRPLLERVPAVRGRLEPDAPLTRYTWFRTGGPAELLFEPADEADLAEFLAGLDAAIELTVIGIGSNLLVRDGGVAGVVLRLPKQGFGGVAIEEGAVCAGGGASDIAVANAAREAGLAGLEFLRGIPGTIGGAVRMNAGAYAREIAEVLVEARLVDRAGARRVLAPADLGFAYRRSTLEAGAVVTGARLAVTPDSREAVAARMAEITQERERSQPVRTRTGGSTFKNPPGRKAWELIAAAGCRGLRIGGAQVSEKHTNFLVNTGAATAADLEALGEEIRRRVAETAGVELDWEIQRIGAPGDSAPGPMREGGAP